MRVPVDKNRCKCLKNGVASPEKAAYGNKCKGAFMITHWEDDRMPEEDKDKGGKGGSK